MPQSCRRAFSFIWLQISQSDNPENVPDCAKFPRPARGVSRINRLARVNLCGSLVTALYHFNSIKDLFSFPMLTLLHELKHGEGEAFRSCSLRRA